MAQVSAGALQRWHCQTKKKAGLGLAGQSALFLPELEDLARLMPIRFTVKSFLGIFPSVMALGVWLATANASPPSRGILREVWTDIGGSDLASLTNSPAYPNNPTSTNYVTDFFEAPTDVLENYGQRMHGFIVPPKTGAYTFWIASDDEGALFLSTDDNPANVRLIARVPGWTSSREWTKYSEQQSAAIQLTAGKAYYISALMKEGTGGDNLAVRWLMPDGVDQAPIVATNLIPYGISLGPPVITGHPTNTTVVEGGTARFAVTLQSVGFYTYRWLRNGVALTGADGPELFYGPVSLNDNNARFRCVVTNNLGSATSDEAVLTVLPDTTPPVLLGAMNLGVSEVEVRFSEPVSSPSAITASNYQLSGGVSVTAARFGSTGDIVILTTSPAMTLGVTYTLSVSNVKDRAQNPNTIAPGSSTVFTVVEYTPLDIGSPPIAGAAVPVKGGADVSGCGDIGGTADKLQFAWKPISGDFDYQVRVANVTVSDPFLHAGLMARETLDANARFASALASSAQLGCFFESRATAGSTTTTTAPRGGVPVNYPQTWLRLKRQGQTITGYAGVDGQTWLQLGSQTFTGLNNSIYLGLAVASGNTNRIATAQFRDAGPTQNTATTSSISFPTEPLGPSSRNTGMIISEIMYHPKARSDGRNLEFIELYNARSVFEDLSGWRLSGDIDFTFPDGFSLQAGEFVVVAASPDDIKAVYGITNVLGPYTGSLPNDSGRIRLRNNLDAIRLEVNYSDQPPWPAAADGAGHSLVLAKPSYGEGDPRAWAASELIGGSPGTTDAFYPTPLRNVVINEFLAHTDPPFQDFIELYNHSNSPVDVSGCWLTDSPTTNRFRIPDNTSIPARGFLVFYQTELGFALDAEGETIYFLDPDATRVLDAVRFGGQENGVASGRSPDGAPAIQRLFLPTPGSANAPRRLDPIVINEIMYHPITEDDNDEFVELHNRSASPVDVSGWRFIDGIDFRIPENTVIPPGQFLVVAKNVTHLRENYPQLTTANSVGNYSGTLANAGERIALAKRDFVVRTNDVGNLVTNTLQIVVAEVTYYDGGRWGRWSDGGGSSLELIDPRADPTQPMNWADSDETGKAPWTTVEFTGRMDNGNGSYSANRLRISMLGPGECLVDDVEFFRVGSTNVVRNGGFEEGTVTAPTSWTLTGNHSRSFVETTGAASGARCLHVRAQGDGDTGINSIRNTLYASVPQNQNATIRAKVRWLAGWPEVLFRAQGNWIEFPARMTIPKNLGTPGLPNSRRVANAGPAIYDVNHTPALPAANETVVVTCRVSDPDGISALRLRYRLDPNTTYTTVTMRDDGQQGDTVAGDGVWSARIPGQTAGTLVAFMIEAVDNANPQVASVFPSGTFTVANPGQECLIRWGDTVPFGTFLHYHMWSTRNTETSRTSGLDNTYRDATLVYRNNRVIYNVGFRDKGSPFHGGRGDFAVEVPGDDRLLGATERVFAATGNGGSEPSAIRSQLAAWLHQQQGVPYLHAHYIRLYRNGGEPYNIMEDLQQPDHDYSENWFPAGGSGDLYKVAVWFEFADDNSNFGATGATLERFTTTGGVLKLARYRWNFQRRSNDGTATNYTTIFDLVTAANNTGTTYVDGLLAIANIDQWMRVFGCGYIMGDWDMWSYGVGQNMFVYKQPGIPSVLLRWDIDFTFGLGNGTGSQLWGGQDPIVNRMYDNPAFRRMLWRGYIDAVNGPMLPERYQPQIDARRDVLVKNGITGLSVPTDIKSFINSRRSYILNQIRANDASTFAITTNSGNDYTSSTPTTTLTGTAPFAVATIEVNGIPFPVTWTDQRTFKIVVPLTQRTNVLALVGKDRRGNPVAGASDTITVTYTGAIERPEDFVVINEIHYNPLLQGAGFLELFNRSTTTPFDLSNFRFDGVGYTFPAGAIIQPNSFLVLASDRQVFANTYGQTVPVFDQFPGTLDNGGEYLALVRPGPTPQEDTIISDVRYDDRLPWPTAADGLGPSLQLIDPAQGSWRVGNWMATETNDVNRVTPARANAARQTLAAFQPLWINEVLPNNLTSITDLSGKREPWIELYNAGNSAIDLSGFYLTDTYTNLTKWQFPTGTSIGPRQFLIVWADGEPAESTPAAPHTNFRLDPQTGSVALVRLQGTPQQPAVMDYLDYVLLSADRSFGSYPDGEPRRRRTFYAVTPGTTNNPAVPPIQVTINEFMAANTSIPDPADGDFDDWFELFNAGSSPVDLAGYTLTDNLSNPTKFHIPPGTIVPAGGFLLVWADEETAQTQPGGNLHVNFKLAAEGESIALFAPDGSLVDSITFEQQTNNVSMGRYPDGGALPLLPMEMPTPGQPNFLPGGNRPPILNPIGDKEIGEMTLLRFTVIATDPDEGQSISYSLGQDAPPGASIEPDSGVFTWTPAENQGPGEYLFTIRATDNGVPPRTAAERIKVKVLEVNRPPVFTLIPDQVVDEGSQLVVPLYATDPDLPPNNLHFSIEPGAPEGVSIDPDGPAVVWTPTENQGPGSYQITVRVTDDGVPPLFATTTFRVTVNEVNNPPEMPFISPQVVNEMDLFTLKVEARDPDQSSSLTFSLIRAPAGAQINPQTGVITWQTTEDDGPGLAIFEVRATENNPPYLSTTRTFSVEVLELNQAPVISAISDRTVREGETVQIKVVATDSDRPPQKLTFSLDPGAPHGASIDPASGLFVWPVGSDVGPSTNKITVRVTDDDLRDPKSATRTFTVTVVAEPRIVINEIMYKAPTPGAEYVELHNFSTNTTWDISGWRLTGMNFLFPPGTIMPPGSFLAVARDLAKFITAYGAKTNALGNYSNELGSDGGVIELYRSSSPSPETLVDRVAFRASAPWPAAANGGGASLQLIDPRQDNSRVANWAAVTGSTTNTPRNVIAIDANWRYWQNAEDPAPGWTDLAYNDSSWPSGKALLYVENADLPAPKNTPLTLGQMSYFFRTTFQFDGYPDGATLQFRTVIDDGAVFYLNGKPFFWLAMEEGVIPERSTASTRVVGDAVYEGPFTVAVDNLRTGQNVIAVEVHQANPNSSDIVFGATVDVVEAPRLPFTPGAPNSVSASLDPFPAVWINEVMALNQTGVTDNAGDRDPWIELVNEGPGPVALDGWYLSNSYSDLTRWAFPSGSNLGGETFKLVWADAEPGETTSAHWHTNFRLTAPTGVVVLSRTQNNRPAVVDFLEYSGLLADKSFGYPNSPSVDLAPVPLAVPTPGAPNAQSIPPTITAVAIDTNGYVRLRWTAVAGKQYRIEYKPDLNTFDWTVLGRVTASSNECEFADESPTDSARFYRVTVVD